MAAIDIDSILKLNVLSEDHCMDVLTLRFRECWSSLYRGCGLHQPRSVHFLDGHFGDTCVSVQVSMSIHKVFRRDF